MNGELKFGIELLKQGDRIGEHIARFGDDGKYAPLQVKDYAVVDFRPMINGEPTKVQRQEHRITVFLSEDFNTAIYCAGTSEEGEFRLQP